MRNTSIAMQLNEELIMKNEESNVENPLGDFQIYGALRQVKLKFCLAKL
jgi:hypothetical protein